MAWLSFIELDKAVVCVIRLTTFLWLWFVCLPSDASHNTYRLTWVSYLGHGVSLQVSSSKVQVLLLTLDKRCLLTADPPDLEHEVTPLCPPVPMQPPLLGRGVAPLERIKYLKINLPKETKDLYIENYKTVMKEIKDDASRWRNIPFPCIRRLNRVKMSILHKAIYRFNSIPINGSFHRTRTNNFTI